MCTLVILRRPGHDWPLIIGANRDEMLNRPWLPPDRHWPDRPGTVAGRDVQAGGSWLGMNDDGVVAAVLNRRHSLGPDADKRSRGELVLNALDHADAGRAADAMAALDGNQYRAFNLVIADRDRVAWLRNAPEAGAALERFDVPDGLSLITERDLNDTRSPRIARYLPDFRDAPVPDPAAGDWSGWTGLLASRARAEGQGPESAMTIETGIGFGTSSSTLIALPDPRLGLSAPVWLFAAGPPDAAPYRPVQGFAAAGA